MYMTPAIAVAILAFAVGLQAQPVTYNDAAIIARSAQPEAWAEAYAEAYADAYADAKLEAREAGKVGEFVTGAIGGIAANTVANQFGQGTSNMNAALLGGGGNVVAHSAQFQKTAQRILGRDAEAEAYADAYADAELEAREAGKVGEFVTGAIGGIAANTVANQFGHGTSNMQAALLGGGGNVVAHSAQFQKTAQRILGRDAVHRLAQRDTEAIMYQLELQRRSHLRDAVNY